jgi:hypothetical protein
MDNQTILKLVWAAMVACCVLAVLSLRKSWKNGEVRYSASGSVNSRKITRADNPTAFKSYLVGMSILTAFFILVVIIVGIMMWF